MTFKTTSKSPTHGTAARFRDDWDPQADNNWYKLVEGRGFNVPEETKRATKKDQNGDC